MKFLDESGLSKYTEALRDYIEGIVETLVARLTDGTVEPKMALNARNSEKWSGLKVQIVKQIPANPDGNTLYIVKS